MGCGRVMFNVKATGIRRIDQEFCWWLIPVRIFIIRAEFGRELVSNSQLSVNS